MQSSNVETEIIHDLTAPQNIDCTGLTEGCGCTTIMSTLGNEDLAWIYLAWVATVAGNLTLMGSVANLIVAEEGRDFFEMSFVYYSKFGFPITIVTLYLGVAIIGILWNLTGQ